MRVSYITPRRIIFVFILLEFFILVMSWRLDGFTLKGLQTVSRFSGLLSLMLFSFIFLFYNRPHVLNRWLSGSAYLLFAIVYGIHLVEHFVFTSLSRIQPIPYRIAGGCLAFVFVFAMPVLQQKAEKGKIKARQFENIETFYIYCLWFIFFMTYLPVVQGTLPNLTGNYKEYVLLLGWVSTLLGYKISSVMRYKPGKKDR